MILVEGLTYRYPRASQDALRAVSVRIEDRSFTAIVGANGSGKSTLARCMNGLLRPTAGRVLVDGLDTANDAQLPAIRRRVGLVFQDPHLQITSPTVEREVAFALQNLAVPTEEIGRRVNDELRRLGLEERRLDPPSSLSGGEKQRLALACVMMLHPQYLVLDEPTTFLSPSSRRALMDELDLLRRTHNTTVVLATQYYDEMRRADRVVVLESGSVIFEGLPGHLARQRSLLQASRVLVPHAGGHTQ